MIMTVIVPLGNPRRTCQREADELVFVQQSSDLYLEGRSVFEQIPLDSHTLAALPVLYIGAYHSKE
jgi:hypothetical protein